MVVRRNILTDAASRDKFIQGVKLLKQEKSGKMTSDFGIGGQLQSVSTYDLFVIWHHLAMMRLTPPNNPAGRNSAHRGPIFLPWHRVMMMLLEQNLQRVLGDINFGLPYWDWAADGELSASRQKTTPIWGINCMGGEGSPILKGPFAFQSSNSLSWRVRIAANVEGTLVSVNRGLRRSFATSGVSTLPRKQSVVQALSITPYDSANWDTQSNGFRNRLEGWSSDSNPPEPELHNRVHVWVGGDMLPSTSPNDPIFYLNHCNIDRLWEAWMKTKGRNYLPSMAAGSFLNGHRINDSIVSPLGSTATPRQVLNVNSIYTYDTLS